MTKNWRCWLCDVGWIGERKIEDTISSTPENWMRFMKMTPGHRRKLSQFGGVPIMVNIWFVFYTSLNSNHVDQGHRLNDAPWRWLATALIQKSVTQDSISASHGHAVTFTSSHGFLCLLQCYHEITSRDMCSQPIRIIQGSQEFVILALKTVLPTLPERIYS